MEVKLDNLEALGQTLKLLIKDTKFCVTDTQADLENFKKRIFDHIERIQLDLVSLKKLFIQLKVNFLESRATIVVK